MHEFMHLAARRVFSHFSSRIWYGMVWGGCQPTFDLHGSIVRVQMNHVCRYVCVRSDGDGNPSKWLVEYEY